MNEEQIRIINHTITRLLASREHSYRELMQKLVSRGLEETLCRAQLQKFVAQNIQSDERFAEAFARSRAAKGQGLVRIRAELREHDIDETLVSQALVELDVDWFELALAVVRKKYGNSPATDWQDVQKRSRFLQYRGFSTDQIRYALGQD